MHTKEELRTWLKSPEKLQKKQITYAESIMATLFILED